MGLTWIKELVRNNTSMGSQHPISMAPFSNAPGKRRIASVMLLFWLFALGAGWANACMLQERGTHVHPDAAVHAGTPTVSAGHVGVVDDHSADPSPGQASCLKVCDGSSQSLVKWSSGIDLPDLAMLLPAWLPWSASVVALAAPQPARFEHPARAGLPLRTLYSRLAL